MAVISALLTHQEEKLEASLSCVNSKAVLIVKG